MPNREKLAEFTAWCQQHITGDEKGQPQIFLDRLFQAFGQSGCLDVGGATEFRIRKADEGRAAGHSYTVQTSTNLTTTNWLSLFTSPAPFTFTDTNASNFIQRFYRAVY